MLGGKGQVVLFMTALPLPGYPTPSQIHQGRIQTPVVLPYSNNLSVKTPSLRDSSELGGGHGGVTSYWAS